MGPGQSSRRPDDRDRHGDLPVPAGRSQPVRRRARRDGQHRRRRPDDQPALRNPGQPVRQRCRVVPLRQLARFGVDDRPQSRGLHSARSGGAHRITGLPHARPDLGSAAADADAHRAGRRRLHHQPARSRDAGHPADPRRDRRGNPGRGEAALPAREERPARPARSPSPSCSPTSWRSSRPAASAALSRRLRRQCRAWRPR